MRQLICYLLVSTCTFRALKADCDAVCDVASETIANGTYFKQRRLCPGDLIFEDNFDNFDFTRWFHEISSSGNGNGEFQAYVNDRNVSFTEDGNLHIKPSFLIDDDNEDLSKIVNPVTSAKIQTAQSFYFRYGTVEARAKMPSGDWLWPAIWLMPRFSVYGGWPTSGEVDILESRGNKNLVNTAGVNVGTQQTSSSLLWGPSWTDVHSLHYETNNACGYDTDFHLYKFVWNSDNATFYVDNKQRAAVSHSEGPSKDGIKMRPFDQEFYLIINLAIGGTNGYFADPFTNLGGKPWNNKSPTAKEDFWKGRSQWEPTWNRGTNASHFIVDYIRVYAI